MAAGEKKPVLEMLAEFLREVVVLVLVFYPLEMRNISRQDKELIILVSVLFLTLGIIVERQRR